MSRLFELQVKRAQEADALRVRQAREEELRLLDMPRPALTPLPEVERMIEMTSPAVAGPQVVVSADPDTAPVQTPAPTLADRWMNVVESGDYKFNQHEQALYDVCRRQTEGRAK